MVKHQRVKDKIPELLSDGPLSERKNLYKYQERRRQMCKIQKHHPSLLDAVAKDIEAALKRLDKWMEEEH